MSINQPRHFLRVKSQLDLVSSEVTTGLEVSSWDWLVESAMFDTNVLMASKRNNEKDRAKPIMLQC